MSADPATLLSCIDEQRRSIRGNQVKTSVRSVLLLKGCILASSDTPQTAGQDQVTKKVALTPEALLAAIDGVRGAVMAAYPNGLPAWDRVRQALEGCEELAGTSVSAYSHWPVSQDWEQAIS